MINFKPNDTEIYFKIALEYWYLQDLPNTAESYEKIIAIDPDHLQAHLNLISVYERQKKWEKAIEEIEIAKRLGKESENEHAINIAEGKLPFITGRMNSAFILFMIFQESISENLSIGRKMLTRLFVRSKALTS